MESSESMDMPATYEKMQNLLKAKDDTSRFVGLALLKTVLDNGHLSKDPQRLRILWESISPKFLDRLLKAQRNENVGKSDAKDMVDLAVAVLHTFTILLPEASQREKRLTGRTAPLVKALVESPSETTSLILQTLMTIVSQREGALEILNLEDLSPLTEIACQYSYVLDIFKFSWINACADPSSLQLLQENIDKVLPALILVFKDTDAVTLISFVGELLPRLDPRCLSPKPKWLEPLIVLIRKLVSRKPTAAGRAAYSRLSAALLQAYPFTTADLLFKNESSSSSDTKPFSYLLVNLLLIDLRSSFPSLLGQLNAADYSTTSQRLASAFDVISSFIGFLLLSLDDEATSESLIMPPDLLLKLRKDISETVSLTIEYLRDRWDASVAGASGLHETARAGSASTSEGMRLTLTWDTMKDDVKSDPLILAGIRAIAIWIREDDNDNLRNETAGLMDMFMELYKESSTSSVDFRYPILMALESIVVTEEGIDTFLAQNGWQILSSDLHSILRDTSGSLGHHDNIGADSDIGLQVVRVLLAILDHEHTAFPEETWMANITTAAAMRVSSALQTAVIIELQIAMLQLATALLSKASGGMIKRYITSLGALSGITSQLKISVRKLDDMGEAEDLIELLDDVSLDLENLR